MLTGTFFVMSISAYYLLRNRHPLFAMRSFTVALILGTIAAVAAPISGDSSARLVAREQPSKLAAMEGLYETTHGPTPITVVGLPDQEAGQVKYAIRIPAGLTLLTYRDTTTPVVGLDHFRPEDRPPVLIPFVGFHLMVAIGTLLVADDADRFVLPVARTPARAALAPLGIRPGDRAGLPGQPGRLGRGGGRTPALDRPGRVRPGSGRQERSASLLPLSPDGFHRTRQRTPHPRRGQRCAHQGDGGRVARDVRRRSTCCWSWSGFSCSTPRSTPAPRKPSTRNREKSKRGGFFAVAADQADAAGPSFTDARRDQRRNEGGHMSPAGG